VPTTPKHIARLHAVSVVLHHNGLKKHDVHRGWCSEGLPLDGLLTGGPGCGYGIAHKMSTLWV
jgi:hypothetical protein